MEDLMRIRTHSIKKKLIDFAPIIGLLLIIVLFALLTEGVSINALNIKVQFYSFMIRAIVAVSAVFVFGSGALDMSMGGSICLSIIVGGIVVKNTESIPLMILVVLGVSIGVAAIKGIVAAVLDLPVFIVTVVLGSVLSAIALLILGDGVSSIPLTNIIKVKDNLEFYMIIVGAFFAFALILFNYTKIGKSIKLIGGNPIAAKQLGISRKKTLITAFMVAGLGVAIASTLILLRTKTADSAAAGAIGTDIMIAIVLGGMPLSGGPRSRISAGLVGAATVVVLTHGLSLMGLKTEEVQIVRGIIFILVVLITSLTYRTKLLPR